MKFYVLAVMLCGQINMDATSAPELPKLKAEVQQDLLQKLDVQLTALLSQEKGGSYRTELKVIVARDLAFGGTLLSEDSMVTVLRAWEHVERETEKPLGVLLAKEEQIKVAKVTGWLLQYFRESFRVKPGEKQTAVAQSYIERFDKVAIEFRELAWILAQGRQLSLSQQYVLLKSFSEVTSGSDCILPRRIIENDQRSTERRSSGDVDFKAAVRLGL